MISIIIELLSGNERAFMFQQSLKKRKLFGKGLAQGAKLSRDFADDFGGDRKEYRDSFKKRGLRRLGYDKNVRYLGAATAKKYAKPKRRRAA